MTWEECISVWWVGINWTTSTLMSLHLDLHLPLYCPIPDRAVAGFLFYQMLKNLRFLYQQDYLAILEALYYAQPSDGTTSLWEYIPWIVYKLAIPGNCQQSQKYRYLCTKSPELNPSFPTKKSIPFFITGIEVKSNCCFLYWSVGRYTWRAGRRWRRDASHWERGDHTGC